MTRWTMKALTLAALTVALFAGSARAGILPVSFSVIPESGNFRFTYGIVLTTDAFIKKKAEDTERERDEKTREAERLLTRHHVFANAVALFQVSIALGAVAALTRNRTVWYGSLAVGLGAAIVLISRMVS